MSLSDNDVTVRPAGGHVYRVVWSRPPNNFLDASLARGICAAVESLDDEPDCRVVVLGAEGKHFCAGGNLAGRDRADDKTAVGELYREAQRLFETAKPLVAAVQGSAVGGGLGLAVAADFRVAADDARLSANFTRLGYYPGFGLTYTLPRLIGVHNASLVLLAGERFDATRARALGLVDEIAPAGDLVSAAGAFAGRLAAAAPLSVQAVRARLRAGIKDAVVAAMEVEAREQARLRATGDFAEGVRAAAARRAPNFSGS